MDAFEKNIKGHKLIDYGSEKVEVTRWKFGELSKTDQNGKTRKWQIGFDSSTCSMHIVHGLSTSLKVDTRKVTAKAKRTDQEQGLQECKNRYKKCLRKGYSSSESNKQEDTSPKVKDFKPQLANKYKPGNRSNVKGFPVFAQPKLDGIRCYVRMEGSKIIARSRTHIEFPWLSHIKQDCEKIIKAINKSVVLDGELYIHKEPFQSLSSIIRKKNEEHERSKEVMYNIFDISIPGENVSSEIRNKIITECCEKLEIPSVSVVKGCQISSEAGLETYHDNCVFKGYEGIVIRQIESSLEKKYKRYSYYLGGRNNALLKFKKFFEEEGEIIDVVCGTGRETNKAILVVIDPRGNKLNIRPEEDFEKREKIYENKHKYIGKSVTYSYQALSLDKVPVFAVAKDLRDYES